MLQTRVGKRTAGAAFRIATQLVDEGLIDMDEAVRRVTGDQLAQLMFPRFVSGGDATQLTQGMNASPGAAVGKAVFSSETAVQWADRGEKVVLVRRETNPDDLSGMIAAEGVLTSRGGKTSHAAVVARGMGKTCVCGAEELQVDTKNRRFTAPGGTVVEEGDVISIDGSTGRVWLGEVPVEDSAIVRYFEGEIDPDSAEADDLVRSVHRILTHADEVRRLDVRTNADTPERSEEHTSELQSRQYLVCRLLLEKKKQKIYKFTYLLQQSHKITNYVKLSITTSSPIFITMTFKTSY